MSSRFALTLLTSCVLAACSGSDTETPTEDTNSAPTHNGNLVYTLAESDDNLTVDLLTGSSDAQGDQLTVTNLVADPNNPTKGISLQNDTVSISAAEFIDDLQDGESLQVLFNYDITDRELTVSRSLTVTITGESVVQQNSAPTHDGDITVTVAESAQDLTIDLLDGAADLDNDQLAVVELTPDGDNPSTGVTVEGTSLSVSPASFADALQTGESETIRFSYKISDGTDTVDRNVNVTITGESPATGGDNQTPTHNGNLAFTVAESASDLTIDLLKGATDLDNDTLTVTELTAGANNPVTGVSVSGSNVTISPANFVDTLEAGESQVVSYNYKISDGQASVERSLTVTITGESVANNAPTHSGDLTFNALETDADLTVDLLQGTSDLDSDSLSITNLTAGNDNPDSGVTVSGSNITISPTSFVDTLAAGESQVITYSFDVTDGTDSVTRNLTVTIQGADPVAESGQVVTVDFATEQYLNEVSVLQRNKFFNLHDNFSHYEYDDATIETYANNYRVGHGRQFWGPFSQNVFKNGLDNNGEYPTEADAISSGSSGRSASLRANTTSRMVVTEHPNNPMYNPTHNDPVKSGTWAADYFEHYFNDENRPQFYEPYNEPFVHAARYAETIESWEHNLEGYIYPGTTTADIRQYITDVHNEIGKAFNARPELDNVNLIGFASAWPSLELWDFGHWESRMKLFMDGAGANVDGISVHLYDGINVTGAETERSGSNAQAILDLIETYSNFKWDLVKPHAITEYGTIVDRPDGELEYNEVVNGQTMRSFNHIMLELMEREDRLLISIPFLTGQSGWYWKSPSNGNGHPYNPALWRPNRDNIELVNGAWQFIDANASDNYLLNINSLFLEFWKDVDGRRALVSNDDPDLQTAAFVNGDHAFVIVSNLEHESKDIDLNIEELTGLNIANIKVERLDVPRDVAATLSSDTYTVNDAATNANLLGDRVTLNAGETIKYTITFDQAVPVDNTAQRKTYYADEHLTPIVANQAHSFNVNAVELEANNADISSAMLRMSIGRKHDKSKQPVVTVNGNQVNVPDDWAGYDQAGRDDFFGAIEIPVPFEHLSTNNVITVTFPDSDGRISSMVLDVINEIDPFVVKSLTLTGDDSFYIGEQTQLASSVTPDFLTGVALTWSSNNEAVATVVDGLVTGVAQGTATITATAPSGVTADFTITISALSSNLLNDANGDFEQALDEAVIMTRNSAGQVNEATYSISADAAFEGSGGLLVDNGAGSLKVQFTAGSIIQNVDTSKNYLVSAQVKVVSGTHTVWTHIENGPGGWKNSSVANSADWQTITIQYSGTELGSNFGLNFHVDPQSNGSGGIIYIDNVTITPVE